MAEVTIGILIYSGVKIYENIGIEWYMFDNLFRFTDHIYLKQKIGK